MNNQLGKHWLLLRGLTRETAHWGDFIAIMQNQFPSAHIHTLDLPGAGRLNSQICPATISEIMESVRHSAFKQDLLQKPLTILALSLSGMVCWEWLLKYPDDLCGAVLVNTSFAGLSPFYRRFRWQNFGKLANIFLQKNIYDRESAIIQLVSNRLSQDAEIRREWHNIQLQHPVSLNNGLRQIIAAARYRPKPDKPKHPVLLINSLGDQMVAQTCSTDIQNQWQLEMRTHPWAGHDLGLDDGDWLANQLKAWVTTQNH
jgi:pimeloyl-ACP methyl ester carboxylesterase